MLENRVSRIWLLTLAAGGSICNFWHRSSCGKLTGALRLCRLVNPPELTSVSLGSQSSGSSHPVLVWVCDFKCIHYSYSFIISFNCARIFLIKSISYTANNWPAAVKYYSFTFTSCSTFIYYTELVPLRGRATVSESESEAQSDSRECPPSPRSPRCARRVN